MPLDTYSKTPGRKRMPNEPAYGEAPNPTGPPNFQDYLPAGSPPPSQAVPPTDSAGLPSGWAAANPMASPSGGEMFGAPVRQGVFRDLYRLGKQSGMPSLMNIGKPPLAPDDPLAGMAPDTTGMPGFPPAPIDQVQMPPLPPSPTPPLNLGVGPQQPHQFPGRAGRLASRLHGVGRPPALGY